MAETTALPATDRITGSSQTKPKKDRGEKRFQMDSNLESFSQNLIEQKTRTPSLTVVGIQIEAEILRAVVKAP
jgi:hypothetical protein